MGRQEAILGTQRLSVLSWAALCAASPRLHGPQNTAGITLVDCLRGGTARLAPEARRERARKAKKTEELKPRGPRVGGDSENGARRGLSRGPGP